MRNFNRPYVRDEGRNFTPIYLQGETYSVYFNPDDLLCDENGSSFQLYIINTAGAHVALIPGLTILPIVGVYSIPYHLYCTFVFPPIPNGQYYFQIWDPTTNSEKGRSNLILADCNCVDLTCLVKFRHDDNLYNVYYNLLPTSFYQIFRLPLSQVGLDFLSERQEYRQSSNGRNLRIGKSFRDTKLTLEAYWFDDEAHEALTAMLEHSEIWINGWRVLNTKTAAIERQTPYSNQTKSNFEVLLDEYDSDALSGLDLYYGGCAPVFVSPLCIIGTLP